jgi:hypothetical protein
MRFYKDRDDGQDDEDFFEGFEEEQDSVSDEEMEEMMDDEFPSDYMKVKMAELSLVEANLNRRILAGVVKTLEKGILWRFLPHHTKLKMIADTYRWYSKLVGE